MLILVINPGSTSTKIAVYEDEQPILLRSIRHTIEELDRFPRIVDQMDFRRDLVVDELRRMGVKCRFDAIIGRGGLAKPVSGGVYEVNRQMCLDMYHAQRQHVCNLGCIIAYELASKIPGCKSYIADPVVVDEMEDVARISGSPLMPRVPVWHALNQKAVGRRFARENGQHYEDLNLIICHLGGGISIAAHRKGRAVDANNGLDGEGPFSPERAGSLPPADLIRLCYSGKYTQEELLKRIAGQAGLKAHLGTTDVQQIISNIEAGDKTAELLIDAM
ncbi:MAG: butyrate kinase, partial [Bacteroidales bacterium]|nr:butyrate kinase [Bacteroidales bacterium]